MKKNFYFLGALGLAVGLMVGAQAYAFQLPGMPKPPTVPSGGTAAPSGMPTTEATAGGGGGGDAVINQLKQCCNEVRYTNTNKVAPKQAMSKIQGCVSSAGGSWQNDQVGGGAGQSLDKKWWQSGWGGNPDGCLTVSLHCGDAECTSCTVVPSSGMKSYCSPFPR